MALSKGVQTLAQASNDTAEMINLYVHPWRSINRDLISLSLK